MLGFASITLVSCGEDEPCDGKTCAAGEVLDALTCNCVSTLPCSGKTCAANEILNATTCQCVSSQACAGKTCGANEFLDAADCNCKPIVVNINMEVTQNISANTTWTSDKVWILKNRVTVLSGAMLTIQPGTIIKGEAGAGANATALLIARGAQLKAEGTAALPIIFTSVADEISPADVKAGNYASPNLDPTVNGLWGGVIILGNAKISASNAGADVNQVQIEGIPTSDQNGLYGGTNDADNSGIIKYISIRHGGTNIGNGNEINGLTLGGVGSGTVIENVEIVSNQDDGIEWFGGTVNVKNAIVWNVGDDGIDTDQSWSGTLENFVVITPTGHCFELDGPEGSFMAGHNIQKGTIIASSSSRVSEDLINVDANSIVNLKDIYFSGIAPNQKINRVTAAGVTFEGIILDVPQDSLASHVNGTVPAGVTI